MAMARTMDRRRLRATALVSSRARVRAWECVFVVDRFGRRTKYYVTLQPRLSCEIFQNNY